MSDRGRSSPTLRKPTGEPESIVPGGPRRRRGPLGLDTLASDAELLAAHCAGDPDAFEQLAGRHSRELWAIALRTLGDPDDAADAVQEALVSAYRRAAMFRGDAAVRTWLRRIVVNTCIDRIRHERVRPTEPWPERDLPSAVPSPPWRS